MDGEIMGAGIPGGTGGGVWIILRSVDLQKDDCTAGLGIHACPL